jgi:hypothetical protein
VALGAEVKRLGKHTAVYGLGGLVSRILAVLLLPLYTHYLGPQGFGKIETVVALTTVLVIVLRMGISSAFFRFYFDTKDEAHRTLVVRTSFWFTMTMATAGLIVGFVLADPIAHVLKLGDDPWLVRAGLRRALGADELRAADLAVPRRGALDPVRSGERRERPDHGRDDGAARRRPAQGPDRRGRRELHRDALRLRRLLAYRRYQLGLQFSRELLREMNRFGMPLVPSALALWAINFIDRIFIAHYKGQAEVGVYSVAVRISSAVVFLMIAFRLAWPAFAYSIEDDREAKRTYPFVLTYLLFLCLVDLARAGRARALARPSARARPRLRASGGRGRHARVRGHRLRRLHGRGDRHRPRAADTVQLGGERHRRRPSTSAQLRAHSPLRDDRRRDLDPRRLPVALPRMVLNSSRVYPVDYQWRRVLTPDRGRSSADRQQAASPTFPLAVAILIALAYPLVLLPLGFYLPAERRRLRRIVGASA